MDKTYFDLGREVSPLCKKGRHDRCAAYDNMVIRCTCACHRKAQPASALDGEVQAQAPLTRERLVLLLDAENVDPDNYRLHGERADEALVMESRPGLWTVYYAERGLRSGERTFSTEDEACRFMLDRLLRDPSTRRR